MIIRSTNRSGLSIPLSSVTRAEKSADGWLVVDKEGVEHRVSDIDWEIAIEGTPSVAIPALPGTYLIGLFGDAGDDEVEPFWRINVLGWMICADTELRPITLDPEANLNPPLTFLHPDGRVEQSDGTSWLNINHWLSSVGPKT